MNVTKDTDNRIRIANDIRSQRGRSSGTRYIEMAGLKSKQLDDLVSKNPEEHRKNPYSLVLMIS